MLCFIKTKFYKKELFVRFMLYFNNSLRNKIGGEKSYLYFFKVLILFFFFILSLDLAFSQLDIYSQDGNMIDYYSFNSPNIKIKTDIDKSNFSIKYFEKDSLREKFFDLSKCGDYFCGEFNVIDLSQDYFVKLVNVSVGSEKKVIRADFQKPVLSYNYSVKKDKLNILMNCTDELSQIKSIKVYQNDSVIGNFNYDFSDRKEELKLNKTFLVKEGSYKIKIFCEDFVKNSFDYFFNIEVNDYQKPEIKINSIEKSEGNLKIDFEAKDKNKIKKYEIVKDNYVVTENINKNSFKVNTLFPYYKRFVIRVIDEFDNVKELDYSLDEYDIELRESTDNQDKIFIDTSADECFIQKINSERINEDLKEKSGDFYYDLDSKSTKSFSIEGFCKKRGYKKDFDLDFFLDLDSPRKSSVDLYANLDGSVKVSWSKSEDDQSKVIYYLYRDSDKVYSGSSLNFKDNSVSFPNEYEYYIVVRDKAGNEVKSSKEQIVPKDVSTFIKLDKTYYKVSDQSVLKINLGLEKGSVLRIRSFVNDELLDVRVENVSGSNFVYSYKPVLGDNILEFHSQDLRGNELTRKVRIFFENLSESQLGDVVEQEFIVPAQSSSDNVDDLKDVDLDNLSDENRSGGVDFSFVNGKGGFWFTFLVSVVFIFIFVFFFYNLFFVDSLQVAKSKDRIFEKEIRRIKDRRIEKQSVLREQKSREKMFKQSTKEKTALTKSKLKDLNKSRGKVDFSFLSEKNCNRAEKKVFDDKSNLSRLEGEENSRVVKKIDKEDVVKQVLQGEPSLELKVKESSRGVDKKSLFEDDYFQKQKRGWKKKIDYLMPKVHKQESLEDEIEQVDKEVEKQSVERARKEIVRGFLDSFKTKNTDYLKSEKERQVQKDSEEF